MICPWSMFQKGWQNWCGGVKQAAREPGVWCLVLLAEHGRAVSPLSASSAQPLLFSSV